MKIVRLAGLIVLAIAAFSLVATSAASAALPLFSPSTKQKITGVSGIGTLVATTGEEITCQHDTSTGEITESMLVTGIVVHFLECVSNGPTKTGCSVKSVNAPLENLIITLPLHGTLGLALPSGADVLELSPESTSVFAHIAGNECTKETKVTGRVAGVISPIGKKTTKGTVTFTAIHPKSAKQSIEEVDLLSGSRGSELVAFSTAASEETTETITFEKEVEVM